MFVRYLRGFNQCAVGILIHHNDNLSANSRLLIAARQKYGGTTAAIYQTSEKSKKTYLNLINYSIVLPVLYLARSLLFYGPFRILFYYARLWIGALGVKSTFIYRASEIERRTGKK